MVGGTRTDSPSVLKDVMTTQRNGTTIVTAPRLRTAWIAMELGLIEGLCLAVIM
jgi:hypothetical protein